MGHSNTDKLSLILVSKAPSKEKKKPKGHNIASLNSRAGEEIQKMSNLKEWGIFLNSYGAGANTHSPALGSFL